MSKRFWKRTKLEDILSDFKTYYKVTLIKTVWWFWHKAIQANGIKLRNQKKLIYGQKIFDKVAKTIWWRKESVFKEQCCENWISTLWRMKLGPYLTLCTKITSNWIKDLNVRPKIIKLLERNIGQKFHCTTLYNIWHDFLDITSKGPGNKK